MNDITPNLDELQIPNEHEHFDNRFYDEDEHWLYFQVDLPSDTDAEFQKKAVLLISTLKLSKQTKLIATLVSQIQLHFQA